MFINFLYDIFPLNRILLAAAIGSLAFLIVLAGGLYSEFVTASTVAFRAFYAFTCTSSFAFIFMMICEEFAIFSTKRDLEHFIDDADFLLADDFNPDDFIPPDEHVDSVTDSDDLTYNV